MTHFHFSIVCSRYFHMYHGFQDIWKDLLKVGLKEDGWPWDWTTLGTQRSPDQKIRARVFAKSEGIWAAGELANSLALVMNSIEVQTKCNPGGRFSPGDLLVEIRGAVYNVLALERPFLNLASYSCGVATATSRLVALVQQACPLRTPRVTLTRKTLPGYRDIAIDAVRIGGGFPHRVNLAGGILIKENHIAAAGNIQAAILGVRKVAPHGLKIEVEVRSEKELQEALKMEADSILLDNFSPEEVKSALLFIEKQPNRPIVEVSGGLSEDKIASYAMPGVDVLSSGALTHSVKSADLTLLVE